MKVLFAIFAVSAISFANAAPANEEKGHFDIEKILKDDKAVEVYVNCFINKVECPAEAKKMKAVLPEAFTKDCASCEVDLKMNTYTFLDSILKGRPDLYAEIEKVYDPKGELKKKLSGEKNEGEKQEEEKKKEDGEKKDEHEKGKKQ